MPHTNRKKKNAGSTPTRDDKKPIIVHTKRKEVEDDEGWTHIIDTPRARSSTLKKKANASLLHSGDFEINGVSYVNRTLEELKTDYEYWKKSWEESEACADLKAKVAEGKEGKKAVDNVVVLGLGSLQSSRREGRRASATQLAALQTIVQTLGGELKVVAQDPQFTDLDKEFLTSLGYAVVDDPKAFELIKEGTLVYAIHCYAKVYKAVSEAPRPTLLIGTDVGNFGRFDTSDTIENIAKSLEDLIDGCEALDFPQIRHDFSDTKIYWRKSAVETAEEEKAQEESHPKAAEGDSSAVAHTTEVPQVEASRAESKVDEVAVQSEVTEAAPIVKTSELDLETAA